MVATALAESFSYTILHLMYLDLMAMLVFYLKYAQQQYDSLGMLLHH